MTRRADRVAGRPAALEPPAGLSPAEAAGDGALGDDDRAEDRPGREPGEMVIALSPRQIIGGFVLLAGIVMVLRRRVGRRGGRGGDAIPGSDDAA